MINVSINGNKLFDWEGSAEEAAKLDKEMSELARSGGMTPERLAKCITYNIVQRGGIEFEDDVPILLWQVLSQPTGDPDYPGLFRDHIDAWDFDFDISRTDDRSFRINVEARVQGRDEQSWLN
jgi:hypothetical protein